MSAFKEALRQAVQAIKQQDYSSALSAAQKAVEIKPDSCDAQLARGKAAYHIGSFAEAQEAYSKAAELQPDSVQVWKGLRELRDAAGDSHGLIEAYRKLLELTPITEGQQVQEYKVRLSNCLLQAGHFEEAATQLQQLLEGDADNGLEPPHEQERIAVLCMLAEARIHIEDASLEHQLAHKMAKLQKQPDPEGAPVPLALLRIKLHACVIASPPGVKLTGTLAELMAMTLPSQRYVRFYETHLSRCLVQVLAAPPRSAEREEKRRAAIQECVHMIVDPRGGCCTPLPYEAAVWLWEEEEELKGGHVASHSYHNLASLPSTLGQAFPMMFSHGALNQAVAAALAARAGAPGPLTPAPPRTASSVSNRGGYATPPTLGSYKSPSGALTPVVASVTSPHGSGTPRVPPGPGPFGVPSPLMSPSGLRSRDGSFDGGETLATKRVTDLGLHFVHQFPGEPAAQAVWGRILRGKYLKDPRAPSAADARRKIGTMLAVAMEAGAPTASGWKALTGLLYQSLQYSAALRACEEALKWLESQARAGHEYLSQCALFLKVIHARSLLKLGRVEEAEQEFSVLADWVTEGEAAFGQLGGSRPMSIHQQSMRGLAQVALVKGDRQAAKQRYERILGATLMGRGAAEHWGHAEYGWMAYEDGDLQTAETQLAKAVEIALQPTCGATGTELGRHQYMLGRVYYELGGDKRTDKSYAYAQFLNAASHEGPHQAAALAWLGRWYQEVALDEVNAKKCFARALKLDASMATAGEGMCVVLRNASGPAAERQLCEGIIQRARQGPPAWALKRLGFLQLQQVHQMQDAPERNKLLEGVAVSFQRALRQDSADAGLWEGLGSALQQLCRLTAAQKTYSRVLALEPQRPYSLVQLALVSAALRQCSEALSLFQQARTINPTDVAALLGEAETRLSRASSDLARGFPTLAAADLAAAAAAAESASTLGTAPQAAWKLLGDVLLLHHSCTPYGALAAKLRDMSQGNDPLFEWLTSSSQVQDSVVGGAILHSVADALGLRRMALHAAQRSYQQALLTVTDKAAARLDLAAALYHEAQLLRCHPAIATAAASECNSLLGQAEKLLRQVLEQDPTTASAWAGLGVTASSHEQREYALIRSLDLDQRQAWVWATLGRLYANHGAPELADSCYEQARCFAPASGCVWESMALSRLTYQQDQEAALQAFQQAVELGPAADTLANWATLHLNNDTQQQLLTTGAANTGATESDGEGLLRSPPDVAVLLCVAGRAVDSNPADPVARHAYGVLVLLNGQPLEAVQQLTVAEQLLLCCPEGHEAISVQLLSSASSALQAVQLSLACAHSAAGDVEAALQRFAALNSSAVQWHEQPAAAVAFAQALQCRGDTQEAIRLLESTLQHLAAGCQAWGACLAALVRCCCQDGAFSHLDRAVDVLCTAAGHPAHSATQPALSQLLQHVANSDTSAGDEVRCHHMKLTERVLAFVAAPGPWAARVRAQACVVRAGMVHGAERVRRWAAAVHACPWSTSMRLGLAGAAQMLDLSQYAEPSACMLQPLIPAMLRDGRQYAPRVLAGYGLGSVTAQPHATGAGALDLRSCALLLVRGTLSTSLQAGAFPAARTRLSVRLRHLKRLLRAQPGVWLWWGLAALLSVRQCQVEEYCGVGRSGQGCDTPGGAKWERAASWCRTAISRWIQHGSGSGAAEELCVCAHVYLSMSEASRNQQSSEDCPGVHEAEEAARLLKEAQQPCGVAHLQLARCRLSAGQAEQATAALAAALEDGALATTLSGALAMDMLQQLRKQAQLPDEQHQNVLQFLQQQKAAASGNMQRHSLGYLTLAQVLHAALVASHNPQGNAGNAVPHQRLLHPLLRDPALGMHAHVAAACVASAQPGHKAREQVDCHVAKVMQDWPWPVPTDVLHVLATVTKDAKVARVAAHQAPQCLAPYSMLPG